MSGNNVIELNGKKYDTKTGKLIHDAHTKPVHTSHPTTVHAADTTANKATKPISTHSPAVRKPARNIDGIKSAPRPAPQRSSAANHTKRPTQHSQTLARRSVGQPHITSAAVSIPQSSTAVVISPSSPLLGVDQARLKRAQHVHQDKRVSRFAVLEPKTTPASPAIVGPTPLAPPAQAPAISARHTPSPLEQAVANATSHTEKKVALKSLKAHHKIAKKLHVRPKTVTTAAALLVVVAIGALVTYRQMPQIQTKIASSRAGVHGSLPSYTPSGFSLLKGVDYQPGQITLTYASKTSDNRSYTVTQADSIWTSDSLRENYLDSLGTSYQTIQQNGKTIYIYDGNATWVDGGVWYRVQAEQANLSSKQLSDIIDSL